MERLHSGKVRDVYADGDDLVLVASDRVSVYDVVLPTPVPDKGKILTQLSLWWFRRLADIVPNHVISEDVPPQWAGRAIRCRRLDIIPVECIARGYLAGLGLREYERDGAVSGVPLPAGLTEGSRLPAPIFTPTTKESPESGRHDEFLTYADVETRVGAEQSARLRDLTLQVYARGAQVGAERGVIVADTKLEFGIDAEGRLVLADEVLTSDSSRFWLAEDWSPGRPQLAYDKQFVRDWAAATGWDKTAPGPAIPDDVVQATRERYVAIYERLTGQPWES